MSSGFCIALQMILEEFHVKVHVRLSLSIRLWCFSSVEAKLPDELNCHCPLLAKQHSEGLVRDDIPMTQIQECVWLFEEESFLCLVAASEIADRS